MACLFMAVATALPIFVIGGVLSRFEYLYYPRRFGSKWTKLYPEMNLRKGRV